MGAKAKEITYEVNDNGCWECTSHAPDINGYFRICINRKQIHLHRYFYTIHNGPIKRFNVVRHTCDNPSCINPEHLIQGTQTDNVQDAVDRNRNVKGITHGAAVLNEQQVLNIFNNTANTNTELAQKYNTTRAAISCIRRGKTWKHLTQ